jgi:hypothetical protein
MDSNTHSAGGSAALPAPRPVAGVDLGGAWWRSKWPLEPEAGQTLPAALEPLARPTSADDPEPRPDPRAVGSRTLLA